MGCASLSYSPPRRPKSTAFINFNIDLTPQAPYSHSPSSSPDILRMLLQPASACKAATALGHSTGLRDNLATGLLRPGSYACAIQTQHTRRLSTQSVHCVHKGRMREPSRRPLVDWNHSGSTHMAGQQYRLGALRMRDPPSADDMAVVAQVSPSLLSWLCSTMEAALFVHSAVIVAPVAWIMFNRLHGRHG